MNFSIIIPSKDRNKSLLRLLFSLDKECAEFYGKVEVLCIDNNSKKSIKKSLALFKANNYELRLLNEHKQGPSFARNKGILNSKYNLLIFIDDDCLIEKGFLSHYQEAWKRFPEAKMIGGKIVVKKKNGKPFLKNERNLLKKHSWCFGALDYGKTKKLKIKETLYTANCSIKISKKKEKIFCEKVGKNISENQTIFGEDYELCNRYMLEGKIVIFYKDIKIVNVIDSSRFSQSYLSNRYWKAGIEEFIFNKTLKKYGFKSYENSLKNELMSFLLNPTSKPYFWSKYEVKKIISYFFNGKYFI